MARKPSWAGTILLLLFPAPAPAPDGFVGAPVDAMIPRGDLDLGQVPLCGDRASGREVFKVWISNRNRYGFRDGVACLLAEERACGDGGGLAAVGVTGYGVRGSVRGPDESVWYGMDPVTVTVNGAELRRMRKEDPSGRTLSGCCGILTGKR